MNFREIRNAFLDYFKGRGHRIVESSSLAPRDDPTLLFTNAGMVQFKRAFLGEDNPGYTRAASSQKCMRAGGKHNDLENVGYTPRHHTFFEMLGNFSFGDYFKEEAIEWGWELLTEGYRLPVDRLYVSVFQDDEEAYRIWEEKIGLPAERIVRLGEKDNFWAMGDTGPCGPCSEIHIDQGLAVGCGLQDCGPGCDCNRFLEIWNLVFTQFDRDEKGNLTPLPRPNIDTGMGLERITAVIQGKTSNYDTDLFCDIIGRIQELSGKSYGDHDKQDVAFRVIADHSRAVAFLIGDGIIPSNDGRGYVLRRIIRRAVRFGQVLGLKEPFLRSVCDRVIEVMGADYNELVQGKSLIQGVVENEERRFADTLNYGMRVLNEAIEELKAKGRDTIPGDMAFKLYDTYGLSLDIVEDVARDEGLSVDTEGYHRSMARQRTLSQESWKGSGEAEIPEVFRKFLARGLTSRFVGYEQLESEASVTAMAAAGKEVGSIAAGEEADLTLDRTPFYAESGGQVGDAGWIRTRSAQFRVTHTFKVGTDLFVHRGYLETGEITVADPVTAVVDRNRRGAIACNHTATHLLHAALREVLGDHVKQAGSLVSPDRLRFDFSHFAQVLPERLEEIERLVNRHIRENLPVRIQVMSKDEAMKTGAMAIFEEKYGETVRLVSVGDGVSRELCGGTHTERTGNIGLFRIVSEGAVAANMRRIEAMTGKAAFEYTLRRERELKSSASLLKTSPDQVTERIERLLKTIKEKEREAASLTAKLLTRQSDDLLAGVHEIKGVRVIVREVEAASPKELREWADRIKDKLGSGIVVLGARTRGKVMLICGVTRDLTGRFHAGDIVRQASGLVGGKGGGRPDMAQGGGDQPEKLGEAFKAVNGLIKQGKEGVS
ncbi:MAG: alanine--tRNA ligase [Deltaproteobacteria bacterium]|nr:alanine--tRNA ligase [Deltaproteobacteria bacterium]